MAQVDKSVLVPHSARQMYELVADVRSYPEFLPWCGATQVKPLSETQVEASVEIRYRGVRQTFTTRNTMTPAERIELELVDGPFSQLAGEWRFYALREDACKVELALRYGFSNVLLEKLVGPVFHGIANSLIDSFTRRAQSLYGR